MTVSDFDSNGLIFALCESASSEKGEPYRSAVRNIMDAQGFDIMPLVDAPRIRTNVNDMTARAVYAKKGGNITHLAQRSGDSVELFPMDQILTVDENESVFHALDALCSHVLDHPSTPFVMMVADSNNNPTALFSIRELLSRRINDAMLSTYLGYSAIMAGNVEKKSKAIHDLLESFQTLHETYEDYWRHENKNSRDVETIASLCTDISKQLHLFSNATISLPRRRQSPPRTDDADVHLIDVMRHGAAGIIWSDEDLERTALACKLLCKANDFDFLTIYDSPGVLNLTHVVDKKGKRRHLDAGYKNHDDLLFDSLDSLFQDHMPLFILPSDEINTGEGALIWPSILSFEEVKNHHGSLWLMTKIAELEESIKQLLPKRRYLLDNGTSTHRDRLTLGMIMKLLKGDAHDSGDIKPLKPQYRIVPSVLEWRNDFSHGMKNESLNLGTLNRENIVRTVQCSELWKELTIADVRTSGKKNQQTGHQGKSKKRSSNAKRKGKSPTKKPSQPNSKPKQVKVFHSRNSATADFRVQDDVQALYNNFDGIFGNSRQVHFTKLHRCIWETWYPGQPAQPFLPTPDVRAWIERFLKDEISRDTFLNSFEERRG
jgi:hypothetical protein